MKKATKEKQIVVRFDKTSYDTISEHARLEHRGLGEFVRHAALVYIEICKQEKETSFLSRIFTGRLEIPNHSGSNGSNESNGSNNSNGSNGTNGSNETNGTKGT